MKKVLRLKNKGAESVILCRRRALEGVLSGRLPELLARGAAIFTDSTVEKLYGAELERCLPGVPHIVMPAGEANKTEETLFSLLKSMSEAGMRRNSVLIAVGGGVVGDVGGLAAALYMRGIACILVPTTLLAQVDASVGGKTAIDFCGVKNLIGAFRQPEEVLVDPRFLATLPMRELRCGLGEVLKHGALHPPLWQKLIENADRLFDLKFLAGIVPENIAFKASVVQRDPEEKGERRSLNLGHTTAHTIELSGGLSHGECVALGLLIESRIAARYLPCDIAFHARLEDLCRRILGEVDCSGLFGGASLALLDKKNTSAGKVTLTVPKAAGEYALLELPFADYERLLKEIGGELC